jgi:hypothetical protein
MIGSTKIAGGIDGRFYFPKLMKLGSDVSCDGTNEMTVMFDELDDFTIELCGGVSAKFADQGIACFPLDDRHDAERFSAPAGRSEIGRFPGITPRESQLRRKVAEGMKKQPILRLFPLRPLRLPFNGTAVPHSACWMLYKHLVLQRPRGRRQFPAAT